MTRQGAGGAWPQTLAIAGLYGVDKTQTEVKYAHQYRDHGEAVFPARSQTEADLVGGFGAVVRLIGLALQEHQEVTAAAVVGCLEGNRG